MFSCDTIKSFISKIGQQSPRTMNYHLSKSDAKNLTKFSMTITNHLFCKQEYNEKNLVISPLSLHTILSTIAAGSDGPTKHQLLTFLGTETIDHLNSLSSHIVSSVLSDAARSGGPHLSFVNAGWVDKSLSFNPSFKEIVATNYMTTFTSLDSIDKASTLINFLSSVFLRSSSLLGVYL
jgi:serpin B